MGETYHSIPEVQKREVEPKKLEEFIRTMRRIDILDYKYLKGTLLPLLSGEAATYAKGQGERTLDDYLSDVKRDEFKQMMETWAHTVVTVTNSIQESTLSEFFQHDVGDVAVGLGSFLQILSLSLEESKVDGAFIRRIEKVCDYWPRFMVAFEDMALRGMSEHTISREFASTVDVDTMLDSFRYFETHEMEKMYNDSIVLKEARDSGVFTKEELNDPRNIPKYLNIKNKIFIKEYDPKKLKADLEGKEIKGNNGVIINFTLNGLRNSLKDRIEATTVTLDIYVEGDELVIQIKDDGKGMDQIHLDPASKEFIGNKGKTDSLGTGLGITNFHTRIPSVGGRVRAVSSRRGTEEIAHFPPDDTELSLQDNPIRLDRGNQETRTLFELRLPLKKKK
ncbi:MAG: ATP-binding protein [Candidatus Magasanikbacteria bacterium]